MVCAVVLLGGLLTLAACGSDGGGSGAGTGGASESAAPLSSGQPSPGANPLWGTWIAPCDRILAALMGETALPEEMTCTGQYTMRLEPDGTYDQSGSGKVMVTAPDGGFSSSNPWSGRQSSTWTSESTGDGTTGTMTIAGDVWVYESTPTPDEDDYPSLEPDRNDVVTLVPPTTSTSIVKGNIPFIISGNTLTMWRTFPEIGQIELVYTRA